MIKKTKLNLKIMSLAKFWEDYHKNVKERNTKFKGEIIQTRRDNHKLYPMEGPEPRET